MKTNIDYEIINDFKKYFDYGYYKNIRAKVQKRIDSAENESDLMNRLLRLCKEIDSHPEQDNVYMVTQVNKKNMADGTIVFVDYTFHIYFDEKTKIGYIVKVGMGVAEDEEDVGFGEYICHFEPYTLKLSWDKYQ